MHLSFLQHDTKAHTGKQPIASSEPGLADVGARNPPVSSFATILAASSALANGTDWGGQVGLSKSAAWAPLPQERALGSQENGPSEIIGKPEADRAKDPHLTALRDNGGQDDSTQTDDVATAALILDPKVQRFKGLPGHETSIPATTFTALTATAPALDTAVTSTAAFPGQYRQEGVRAALHPPHPVAAPAARHVTKRDTTDKVVLLKTDATTGLPRSQIIQTDRTVAEQTPVSTGKNCNQTTATAQVDARFQRSRLPDRTEVQDPWHPRVFTPEGLAEMMLNANRSQPATSPQWHPEPDQPAGPDVRLPDTFFKGTSNGQFPREGSTGPTEPVSLGHNTANTQTGPADPVHQTSSAFRDMKKPLGPVQAISEALKTVVSADARSTDRVASPDLTQTTTMGQSYLLHLTQATTEPGVSDPRASATHVGHSSIEKATTVRDSPAGPVQASFRIETHVNVMTDQLARAHATTHDTGRLPDQASSLSESQKPIRTGSQPYDTTTAPNSDKHEGWKLPAERPFQPAQDQPAGIPRETEIRIASQTSVQHVAEPRQAGASVGVPSNGEPGRLLSQPSESQSAQDSAGPEVFLSRKQAVLALDFRVDTPIERELYARNLADLKTDLARHGLHHVSVSIDLGDRGQRSAEAARHHDNPGFQDQGIVSNTPHPQTRLTLSSGLDVFL